MMHDIATGFVTAGLFLLASTVVNQYWIDTQQFEKYSVAFKLEAIVAPVIWVAVTLLLHFLPGAKGPQE